MKHELNESSVDRMTTAIKLAVGHVPAIGPIISELIGSVIPNQRIDRIVRFIEFLDARLTELEVRPDEQDTTNPEFVDILEDGFFQAARAVTNDRLERIACVVATGLSESDLKYEETKRMLWLLDQLNDQEITLLRGQLPVENTECRLDEDFQTTHQELLRPWASEDRSRRSSAESQRRAAVRESYLQHLSSLKLLENGNKVSLLGRMLLRYLDLIPDWNQRLT